MFLEQLKANRVLIIAVLLGIFATVAMQYYLKNKEKTLRGGNLVKVLVASSDLKQGTILSDEMIAEGTLPENYVTKDKDGRLLVIEANQENRDFLIKQTLGINMSKGQPFHWDYINVALEGGMRLGENERAITIPVDEITGVAGLIRPNDRVDILGTFEIPSQGNEPGYIVTKTLLQNVTVLAIGSTTAEDVSYESFSAFAGTQQKSGAKVRREYTSVTIKVDPTEAEMIAFAQDRGTLRLILRGPDDININTNLPIVKFNNILQLEEKVTAARKEKPVFIAKPPEIPKPTGPELYEGGTKKDER